MKINWKNRFKNGTTLSGLISLLLLLIKQVTEMFGVDLSQQLAQISDIIATILLILAGLGLITNPNTKGLSDAGIDFELNKPRNENTHPVQFKSESGAVKPENFDTNEPFTDDSDEEEFEFNNDGGGAPDENTISNQ
ncbi:phage holin [Staphylococcus capitis]|uniref:phage holin n=1 Tax=Staphylococcus capitis TaxID=29388 RepID=UPI0007DA3950|nr:phage holin [Staphylococcus capitis]OAO27288.1 holin [Staphylococcus capitis]OAO29737.1 holin [Staphylococcus capitis]